MLNDWLGCGVQCQAFGNLQLAAVHTSDTCRVYLGGGSMGAHDKGDSVLAMLLSRNAASFLQLHCMLNLRSYAPDMTQCA